MTGTDPGVESEDFQADLLLLASPELEHSERALKRLLARVRQPSIRHLERHGIQAEDAEDILQEASQRIWLSRYNFEPRGPWAWWRFVQKVIGSCAVDYLRKRGREFARIAEIDEVPEADIPYLESLILLGEDRRRVYALADSLWLDLPDDHQKNRKRLLAAQLFFLHRLDIEKVAALLGMKGNQGIAELDDWLADRCVLLHFAYSELYWSNDRLAGHLLRPESPLSTKEIDILARSPTGSPDALSLSWSSGEALAILLRFRNGLLTEQIARFKSVGLDTAHLLVLFERCQDLFPQKDSSRKIVLVFESLHVRQLLLDTGLWRRIVFQYSVMDELPHKQILERTTPAADAIGAPLTSVMLHAWLSMGRLFTQLAAFAEQGRR